MTPPIKEAYCSHYYTAMGVLYCDTEVADQFG